MCPSIASKGLHGSTEEAASERSAPPSFLLPSRITRARHINQLVIVELQENAFWTESEFSLSRRERNATRPHAMGGSFAVGHSVVSRH